MMINMLAINLESFMMNRGLPRKENWSQLEKITIITIEKLKVLKRVEETVNQYLIFIYYR